MNIILQGLHQSASDCMHPKERHEVLDITNEYYILLVWGVWILIIFIEVLGLDIRPHFTYDISLAKKKEFCSSRA